MEALDVGSTALGAAAFAFRARDLTYTTELRHEARMRLRQGQGQDGPELWAMNKTNRAAVDLQEISPVGSHSPDRMPGLARRKKRKRPIQVEHARVLCRALCSGRYTTSSPNLKMRHPSR